jgi:2-iminobutanoate/2-iminopropanoate deaminase
MSEMSIVYTEDAAFRKFLLQAELHSTPPSPLTSPFHRFGLASRNPSLPHFTFPFSTCSNTPPAAGPYSQAIKTSSTIYCSGQIPCTPSGEILTADKYTIGQMTEQCIKNLSAVLTAAGSSLSKVVKVNVFITTMDDFAPMNAVYETFFTHKPARSCVAVKELPKGVPVEIECIALA